MTHSQIIENKKEFLTLVGHYVHRDGINELVKWLEESDFFTAPASTKYHLNEDGGLCQHSLHVYYNLRRLYTEEYLNYELSLDDETSESIAESVAIVALFHDLCKVNMYKPTFRNVKTYDSEEVKNADRNSVKKDGGGYFIWKSVEGYEIDDEFPMGHGEKSLCIVMNFIKLSEQEKYAIRWHMGFSDDNFKAGSQSVGKAFEKSKLAVLTHIADLMATYFDEGK